MLDINTYYNFQPHNFQKKQVSSVFLKPLPFDTVSFKSKNLLVKPSEEITKEIKNAVTDKKIIGFSSEGVVYDIPDTEYCVKIYNGESTNNFGKWKMDISSQDKINHIVARAQNDSVIMKKIEGEPLNWEEKPEEIYNLPKSSYKNLLMQISNAYDECLMFDKSPANIIYNKKNNSFTIIDFFEPNPDVDVQYRPLQCIFEALKARKYDEHSVDLNKKLGIKLLSVVDDELSKKEEPDFYINKSDIETLLYEIYVSQSFKIPEEVVKLRKSIGEKI
ncbi:MAG: hypothetical protein K6E29_02900 [Cyanobacteria bacterium RUI128]|nr:hypothetical protein [Cyanobacteria bacterium RUI128]